MIGVRLSLKEGDKFGMLIYLKDTDKKILPCGQSVRMAYCKCECGNYKEVALLHLVRGRITTCGCTKAEYGDGGTLLHTIWRGMINRCKPNYFQSKYYYKKGISVCEEWLKFRTFKEWALSNGYKGGLQIDRIKNDKGYFPINCRFVTQQENLHNRDITTMVNIYDISISFYDFYNQHPKLVSYETALRRFKRGWDLEKSVSKPSQCPKRNIKHSVSPQDTN